MSLKVKRLSRSEAKHACMVLEIMFNKASPMGMGWEIMEDRHAGAFFVAELRDKGYDGFWID